MVSTLITTTSSSFRCVHSGLLWYHLILVQGETESIAQMKLKAPLEHEDGLLKYLEDIIGILQYKGPIDKALIRMKHLTKDCTEKLNCLRLVERKRNTLEKERRKAKN